MAEKTKEKYLGFDYFLVEARGYKKQFTSQIQARRTFSKREKIEIENEQPFFAKLFGKKNLEDEWTLLDEVQIEEEFYKDN